MFDSLKKLFVKSKAKPRAARKRPMFQLNLEHLEQREVPTATSSVLDVTGQLKVFASFGN